VLLKQEMIYQESALGVVHFTFSLQCWFAGLYGDVYITENDIYWSAGVQQWLKQNMASPVPLQNRLYSELCFLCPQNMCIGRNKLPDWLSIATYLCCNFAIDRWHERPRAKLHWLLGGGGAGWLSPNNVKQRWLSALTTMHVSLISEMDGGSPRVWIWTGVTAIPRGNCFNRTFWNDRLTFSGKKCFLCVFGGYGVPDFV
jgi:hypothetical protein